MALYNKYRPTSLDLICGQEHIKKILAQQIKRNALSNSYLFIGSAGTGKTTLARILCAMINCSTGPTPTPSPEDPFVKMILSGEGGVDVQEIDAATHGRIEDVRKLRDRVPFSPMQMSKKIWIIDECHRLTDESWQALLKVLEEPPPHAMFIFCTTDPTNIPETILTRSMVLQFHAFSVKDILVHIKKISTLESKAISDECLKMIAYSSRGSMRQALSTLDKIMLLEDCTPLEVAKIAAVPSRQLAKAFLVSTFSGKFNEGLRASAEVISCGVSSQAFLEEVANYVHDLMVSSLPEYSMTDYGYSQEEADELKGIFTRMCDVFNSPILLLQNYVRLLDMGHKLTTYNIQPQFHVDTMWIYLHQEAKKNKK